MKKFDRKKSMAQLAFAVVFAIVAWFTAADLGTKAQHHAFVDFFASSAAVIAALLIALAIEARAVLPLKAYAIVAPACLAVGEIAAVGALSPGLPGWSYRWLLALTVGGGLGGLIAVIWAASMLLRSEVEATRMDAAIAAGARAAEAQHQRDVATAAAQAEAEAAGNR